MSLIPRTNEEIELLRKSGEISAIALKKVLESVKEGVSLLELEKIAEDEIIKNGGESSFKSVPGYFHTTCLTVNDEVVHGLPRDIVLKKGDILSIDLGTVYKGWHTDCAWSVIVSGKGGGKRRKNEKLEKFLKAGEKALWDGIDKAQNGNKVGDISNAIQTEIEKNGYRVVRSLVGHGVGKELHEEPEIPGYGAKGKGITLKSGMSLAIEAIYTESTPEVDLASDGWTIVSGDGSLGGLFEMSVIVLDKGCEVLTDWRSV